MSIFGLPQFFQWTYNLTGRLRGCETMMKITKDVLQNPNFLIKHALPPL